jgi:septum formation protein
MTQLRRPLLLATASPRRRKILAETGVAFDVATPAANEVFYADQPLRTARENAALKYAWAQARYPGHLIVTADTLIDFDGRCVTKPSGIPEAYAILRAFSGREHTVLTALGLTSGDECPEVRVVSSGVRFRQLDDGTIAEYFRRVDPLDKAGAYDIDQHGEMIVASFSGSRTNIMGLPKEEIEAWLSTWAA